MSKIRLMNMDDDEATTTLNLLACLVFCTNVVPSCMGEALYLNEHHFTNSYKLTALSTYSSDHTVVVIRKEHSVELSTAHSAIAKVLFVSSSFISGIWKCQYKFPGLWSPSRVYPLLSSATPYRAAEGRGKWGGGGGGGFL